MFLGRSQPHTRRLPSIISTDAWLIPGARHELLTRQKKVSPQRYPSPTSVRSFIHSSTWPQKKNVTSEGVWSTRWQLEFNSLVIASSSSVPILPPSPNHKPLPTTPSRRLKLPSPPLPPPLLRLARRSIGSEPLPLPPCIGIYAPCSPTFLSKTYTAIATACSSQMSPCLMRRNQPSRAVHQLQLHPPIQPITGRTKPSPKTAIKG
ncbi:uncharacterized protein BDZ83DRAFT_447574 [Colletotrichum acutatum]|uniref:Uncharacterized protein n=1 Tax=Glomerella acutata TaxID=27357 RepID=A0AAD8XM73_GLOAC|nr:uncharacterized protein BDZ83DRAFT_447574 [Colletotrichum acutatum]KAK1729873.1 hypothetical protein BDZ83DRAFT_447574 [Colletotrichum acutatum]